MLLHSSVLGSLRFFEATSRLLSFKHAADELHVTHSAASQHIKHLEEVLGVKLFHRLARRVELTPVGQRFAEVVRKSLNDIDSAAEAIASRSAQDEIRVRVGPSFALRWLLPRLPDLYGRHPDIRLRITGAYGRIDPNDRSFDLAIELSNGQIPQFEAALLMHEVISPVCSPAYLADHPLLREPEDLAQCTLLHDAHAWNDESEDAEWRYWLREIGVPGVDSRKGLFFSLSDMCIEAALRGQGVAMSRASLVSELLGNGELVSLFNRPVVSPAAYFLVYLKEGAERHAVRETISWLRQQIPEETSGLSWRE
jgi:LysR family transcriptional regulator, glycine cleavage system transcriptional activator